MSDDPTPDPAAEAPDEPANSPGPGEAAERPSDGEDSAGSDEERVAVGPGAEPRVDAPIAAERSTQSAVEGPDAAVPSEPTPQIASEARSASPWPIIGWLLFVASVTVVGVAAWAGLLLPAVVLDAVSFWPAWVVALLLALALWPLRRRGIARIGAVLPLLLFSWLTAAVGLHLLEWDQLPSSSADLRGPESDGTTAAELAVEVSGSLTLRSGADTLYDVRLVRSGGDTGPPDALERLVPSAAVITLQERSGAGWFRSSGWRIRLESGPAWDLALTADEIDISTRGLNVRSLSVSGDGTVQVGTPAVDMSVVLDGDLNFTVPAGVAVEVRGAAGVPDDWESTEDGARSNGAGAVIHIDVADGALARVFEG